MTDDRKHKQAGSNNNSSSSSMGEQERGRTQCDNMNQGAEQVESYNDRWQGAWNMDDGEHRQQTTESTGDKGPA